MVLLGQPKSRMSTFWQIDFAIVVIFLVGMLAFGLYAGRGRGKSADSYFLGNRQFSWIAIGASLFATNINSASVLGASGLTSRIGIASSNNELIGSVMLCLAAVFIIPIYISQRLYTVPEFLEKRFNRAAKVIFGGSFVIQSVLAGPIGFYASGLAIIHIFGFPESSLFWICLSIACCIGLYSIVGGLASVVYTDIIQASVLLLGCLVLTLFGLSKVGGLSMLYQSLGPEYFSLLRPANDFLMPWTAVVSGMTLHSAFFALCSVAVLQRTLGARDVFHAQCGLLFGAFLKLVGVVVLIMPGLIALRLYPEATGDASLPVLIRELLPVGFSGLVLAALLCATMSTADSGVCAISSVVALDLYPAFVRKANPQKAVVVGRITAALVLLFGVCLAPLYANMGLVYLMVLKVGAPLAVPVGTCYLFGRFSSRVNEQGAVVTLLLGFLLAFAYVISTSVSSLAVLLPSWLLSAHFYHLIPGFFVFSTCVLFAVSWLTPPPRPEQLSILTVTKPTGNEEHIWGRRIFKLSIILMLFIVGSLYVLL